MKQRITGVAPKNRLRILESSLDRGWSRTLDAPGWLWQSLLDLISTHEAGYLEHCRRYGLS